jgi:hypothetical protein
MSVRIKLGVLALAATVAACDRPAPTAPLDDAPSPTGKPADRYLTERGTMDRLARRLAQAMADPGFRAELKAQLDRSPFAEHKIQFQNFLEGSDRRALKQVAHLSAVSEDVVSAELQGAIPLEIYFPVPSHRVEWTGGLDVLVASARGDRDVPVAYDVRGRKQLLSPDQPPSTPVLAMVPVETDFSRPLGPGAEAECQTCGGSTGGGVPSPPPGLYMTYSHFVQDFEGWLKGSPEFEFHILGQSGASDSLRDYQCAGGSSGGYYRFDQNDLNWSGSVLLFSQAQLSNYRSAHPNQNFRIIALEDDDTACIIKFDANRFRTLVTALNTQYPNLTGTKDTSSSLSTWVKRANALQKILSAVYSFITTQDDLIGNGIEDVVVGQFYPGANWILKGENNKTNGWIKLEMR